jgi:hypothetical protein
MFKWRSPPGNETDGSSSSTATTGQQPHVMGPPDPVKLSNQELEICKILGLSKVRHD